MEISYWKSRWKNDRTGWHMETVYPHLKTYWNRLRLKSGSTVLVPLCGKSLDLTWLKQQGHQVIGVEVSERAVLEYISESSTTFSAAGKGAFTIYSSEQIQLWIGDFFKMEPHFLPEIEAVYDKAALIALPPDWREDYVRVVKNLCTPRTRLFLNTFEYDQSEMNGPPFAVHEEEIRHLYGDTFRMKRVHQDTIFEEMIKFQHRGLSSYLNEKVYLGEPTG